jgi:hypothetical protein
MDTDDLDARLARHARWRREMQVKMEQCRLHATYCRHDVDDEWAGRWDALADMIERSLPEEK